MIKHELFHKNHDYPSLFTANIPKPWEKPQVYFQNREDKLQIICILLFKHLLNQLITLDFLNKLNTLIQKRSMIRSLAFEVESWVTVQINPFLIVIKALSTFHTQNIHRHSWVCTCWWHVKKVHIFYMSPTCVIYTSLTCVIYTCHQHVLYTCHWRIIYTSLMRVIHMSLTCVI